MDPATIALLLPAAVGVLSALATVTPNTATGKVSQKLLDIINLLGMNVGKAANKE